MKKKVIIDLITAHYEDDPRLFFRRAIEILKEFQEDGDKELVEYVSNILKSKVKIAPKREVTKLEDLHEEISFEDAADLGWVPMEPSRDRMEFQDYSVCPKCGSHNIESNKDINNPFIRCKDCGYYLREGKKSILEEPALDSESKPKNSGYVAVDYTIGGTVACRSTDDPTEAITTKELKKLFN